MAETFHQNTVKVCRKIPKGRVATYGMVAMLAGSPRAARQVVRVLNVASEKEGLPWHRLISREGRIALRPGQGFEMQKALLEAEGVVVGSGGEIDLGKYLWKPRLK